MEPGVCIIAAGTKPAHEYTNTLCIRIGASEFRSTTLLTTGLLRLLENEDLACIQIEILEFGIKNCCTKQSC